MDMAASSSRALWKGAISFGLVHIPVSLHSATTESGVNFDWLDKRSMDPVGYKRINKKTGKEISKENIVKGVEYESGKYVVLSADEIEAVYPKSTQSIDIEAFVSAADIPFIYLERPYYLAPIGKGEKVYALLRETLLARQRIGLARVVIQTKQHLAALVPVGPALVLNLLRWGADIRSWEDLKLPKEGSKATGLTARELDMAGQLVDDMSGKWEPEKFTDSFKDQVMALVDKKVKAGQTESVVQPEEKAPSAGADIIDLTALLKQSLRGKGSVAAAGTASKSEASKGDTVKRRGSAASPAGAAKEKEKEKSAAGGKAESKTAPAARKKRAA